MLSIYAPKLKVCKKSGTLWAFATATCFHTCSTAICFHKTSTNNKHSVVDKNDNNYFCIYVEKCDVHLSLW